MLWKGMRLNMKISVLTPSYNRGILLKNLYNSLLKNKNYAEIEWLIMDDGSTDETKQIIEKLKSAQEPHIEIKYFYEENQGKMVAINNLVEKATGDLIVDCDSDDYFTDNAFKIISKEYEKYKEDKSQGIYAFCFLKSNQNGKNMGEKFKKPVTTMFDLYFKEGEDGEKALVFISDIRKKYKHKLEHNEKFVTEARMYHEMDLQYKIKCVNETIMICEYQEAGYTKNINQQFIKNPYGYYKYFQEILQHNMQGVTWNKRLYAIKHYILFSYLTKQYSMKNINGLENKFLYVLLLMPGILKSKKFVESTQNW